MCENNSTHADVIDNFRIALKMREFEITQLTQRNNFFMIFQGVLFAGLVQSAHTKPVVSFMVCIAGLFVAIFQIGMASGAKFWQEYWEQMLSEYERKERGRDPELFHNDESRYANTVKERIHRHGYCGLTSKLILTKFSVSRIPIYVGIAFSVAWALLALSTLRSYPPIAVPGCIVGF